MILRSFAVAALAAAALAFPSPARAELVTLTSGRTLSVRAVDVSGDQAVLTLRGGGQMTCAASLIARIAPDEVPHDDPVGEGASGDVAVVGAQAPVAGGGNDQPRPAQYDQVIAQAARRHNVDPKLVHAVIRVESGYKPTARSRAGAMGMMQLMPGTARDLDVANPYDAAANIEGGVRYLRQLLDRFELRLALAAYNAGAATVERFGGIPPYPETRAYVSRVLRLVGSS